MGVAIAIRNALRSGDIYIPESKKHVSFWNLIYSKKDWARTNLQVYEELELPRNTKTIIDELTKSFHETAELAQKNLGKDGFANIKNGKLKLNKPDKLIVSDNIKALQKKISTALSKIKIEQLLLDVDRMTGFSRQFTPIHRQGSIP